MATMKRTILGGIAALGIALIPLSSTASTLQDWGMDTFDSATNLAWLDTSLTTNLTQAAALGNNPAYRVATNQEVTEFFLNGGMTAVDDTYRASDLSAAQGIIALLGGATFVSIDGAIGVQARTTANAPIIRILSSQAEALICCLDFANTPLPGLGTFLVREVTPVPLPATGLLLLAALGLVGVAKSSRRTVA